MSSSSLVAAGPFEMTSRNDRVVLLVFFWPTNGPSWRNNLNWNVEGSCISTWHGVTVDDDGRVAKLELPSNLLEGEESPQLQVNPHTTVCKETESAATLRRTDRSRHLNGHPITI